MTTCGVTTSCSDCDVNDQNVDITARYDHVVVNNDHRVAAATKENGEQVRDLLAADVVDIGQPTVALPPDGGWGWAVVAAAFVSNLIVGGICYMFGIIMPELLEYFQAGKGKTAFVGSLVPGTLSVVGKSISPSSPKPPMLSTDGMSRHRLTPYTDIQPTIIHNNY